MNNGRCLTPSFQIIICQLYANYPLKLLNSHKLTSLTHTIVAFASIEFSTSSLTIEAGVVMTCVLLMSRTVSGGSERRAILVEMLHFT